VFSFGTAMSTKDLSFGVTGVIFQFLVSIGLFFGTGWLMNHKVNINKKMSGGSGWSFQTAAAFSILLK